MNWNQVEGHWHQLKGTVKERYGLLTDDELDVIAGQREKLLGKLQERYGLAQEAAERELEDLLEACAKVLRAAPR